MFLKKEIEMLFQGRKTDETVIEMLFQGRKTEETEFEMLFQRRKTEESPVFYLTYLIVL